MYGGVIMSNLKERFLISFTENNGKQLCKIFDKTNKKEVMCEMNNLNKTIWKMLGV